MKYPRKNLPEEPTEHEKALILALRDYGPAEYYSCWVPSDRLWRVYCYRLADDNLRLNPSDFGRAMKRVFPHAVKVRRRIDGKPTVGYAFLEGPGARSMWLKPF